MAYKEINNLWGGTGEKYEFILDSDADFQSLPQCCPGSSAVCAASGKVYVVNASGQWVEFGAEG